MLYPQCWLINQDHHPFHVLEDPKQPGKGRGTALLSIGISHHRTVGGDPSDGLAAGSSIFLVPSCACNGGVPSLTPR